MAAVTEQKATNVVWHEGEVTRDDRAKILGGQKGCTLWLTGLSGAGKSTVSVALEKKLLLGEGVLCYRLDGDNIRMGLNKNLGFTDDDRSENIRRIGEVSKLMCDINIIVMTAFISPFKADRQIAREVHEKDGTPFYEVHVTCPLSVAEERDPKGLYKKARAGEIKHFTGIDSPYEEPEAPELVIDTSKLNVEQCAEEIYAFLVEKGCIPKKE